MELKPNSAKIIDLAVAFDPVQLRTSVVPRPVMAMTVRPEPGVFLRAQAVR